MVQLQKEIFNHSLSHKRRPVPKNINNVETLTEQYQSILFFSKLVEHLKQFKIMQYSFKVVNKQDLLKQGLIVMSKSLSL